MSQSLESITSTYKKALAGSPAEEYLASRSLSEESIHKFALGYVAEPAVGHERFEGMLAIPYLRRGPLGSWKVVGMRFRALDPDVKPKYNQPSEQKISTFNPQAVLTTEGAVGICEGEIDAISACQVGLPTVGIPGAQAWKPWWAALFEPVSRVIILADGDEPGLEFAAKVKADIPQAVILPHNERQDTNSVLVNEGEEALAELINKYR